MFAERFFSLGYSAKKSWNSSLIWCSEIICQFDVFYFRKLKLGDSSKRKLLRFFPTKFQSKTISVMFDRSFSRPFDEYYHSTIMLLACFTHKLNLVTKFFMLTRASEGKLDHGDAHNGDNLSRSSYPWLNTDGNSWAKGGCWQNISQDKKKFTHEKRSEIKRSRNTFPRATNSSWNNLLHAHKVNPYAGTTKENDIMILVQSSPNIPDSDHEDRTWWNA